MKKNIILFLGVFLFAGTHAQIEELKYIPAEIDFSQHLQQWDGFGFNYVETCQTRDYDQYAQDYGGFSLLSKKDQEEIIEAIFGTDGLQVQIVKMFLDPFHQAEAGGEFDHEKTTSQMQKFVTQGLDLTRKRGDDLEIITTLYGPPAWATKQKFIGGRDLDPSQVDNLGSYMCDWTKYLKDKGCPVKYISLHNEGEDFYRWNYEDGTQRFERFDYNMYWPPEQVNLFIKRMPDIMKKHGLNDVVVTNGEPSNWTRFHYWVYSTALRDDPEAMAKLGLLTTHGFINGNMEKLSYASANSLTTDMLRMDKPDLHAWITSFSWGKMSVDFVRMVHEHIYTAKVNAVIPWAGIQNQSQWIGGDPNLGTAIIVNDDGSFEYTMAYCFYKQLTWAGKRSMAVAGAFVASPQAHIIAFSSNNSDNPDAFVLTSNIYVWGRPIKVNIKGSKSQKYRAYRTMQDGSEKFREIGIFEVQDGSIIYDPPQASTTTFIAVD